MIHAVAFANRKVPREHHSLSCVHGFDEKRQCVRLPGREEIVLHGVDVSLKLHEVELEADRAGS